MFSRLTTMSGDDQRRLIKAIFCMLVAVIGTFLFPSVWSLVILISASLYPMISYVEGYMERKKEQWRKEKARQDLGDIPVIPLADGEQQYFAIKENVFATQMIDNTQLTLQSSSIALKSGLPEIATAIHNGNLQDLRLCIVAVQVVNFSKNSFSLALCRYHNGVSSTVLALINSSTMTSHELCNLRELSSSCRLELDAIIQRKERLENGTTEATFVSLRSDNRREIRVERSTKIIMTILHDCVPAPICKIIAEYQQGEIYCHEKGISEDLYCIIENSSEQFDIKLPKNSDDYLCSMSCYLLFDPVTHADETCKKNFERTVIQQWIEEQQWGALEERPDCPHCKQPITQLVPNTVSREEIRSFINDVQEKLSKDISKSKDCESLIYLCKDFLAYGNATQLMQEKYNEFLAHHTLRARRKDHKNDDHRDIKISCVM